MSKYKDNLREAIVCKCPVCGNVVSGKTITNIEDIVTDTNEPVVYDVLCDYCKHKYCKISYGIMETYDYTGFTDINGVPIYVGDNVAIQVNSQTHIGKVKSSKLHSGAYMVTYDIFVGSNKERKVHECFLSAYLDSVKII